MTRLLLGSFLMKEAHAAPASAPKPTNLRAVPYKVQPGDTPDSVAKKYGITAGQLQGLNNSAPGSSFTFAEGMVILVPAIAKTESGVGKSKEGELEKLKEAPPIPPGALNNKATLKDENTPAVPASQKPKGLSFAVLAEPKSPPVANPPKSAPAKVQDERNTQVNDDNINLFKSIVEDGEWQVIPPNKRSFTSLSRYYMNQISCPGGKITQTLIPQDKYIEAELIDSGEDLFLRVGNNPEKQFPIDITVICDNQVFLMNAVINTKVPSQQIRLQLNKDKKREFNVVKYKENIDRAIALPLEEQLLRIAKRAINDDYLPYWEEIPTPVRHHMWKVGNSKVVVNNVVRTNINGYVVWDFLIHNITQEDNDDKLLRELYSAVIGTPRGIGKLIHSKMGRLVIITQEKSPDEFKQARIFK